MNNSKKLIAVRFIVAAIILFFCALFVFLFMKIDVTGHLFKEKRFVRVASVSNLSKYLEDLNAREYNVQERPKVDIYQVKKETNKVNNYDKTIFKFINIIKKKREHKEPLRNIESSPQGVIQNKTNEDSKTAIKKIQDYYDRGIYNKNSWIIIDEDLDGYGFNFYFDEKGKLKYDTVTPDYRIVDSCGREIDDNLVPIIYVIKSESAIVASNSDLVHTGSAISQVIITEGVALKERSKFYDNKMNRKVVDYIDSSLRFKKTTNGTICNGSKWKGVSSLKDDGGYVIFNNPENNFNKIIGKISTQYDGDDDAETYSTLYVYDADLYETYKGLDRTIEPLYETSSFNYTEPLSFNFTFYRTVKRLRFQIETYGYKKHRTCYLKNLRYGFNNAKYKEELEDAKDNEAYVEYLKDLGLYETGEDMLAQLKLLEEDSQSDYLEYRDFDDMDLYEDIDTTDYEYDMDNMQEEINKRTGPAFDDYLRGLKNYWEIKYGPGYK